VRLSPRAWRRTRQAVQVLSLVLFLALFIYADAQRPQRFWADLYSRLDPLLMLAASLAGRAVVAGLALAVIVLVVTLLFGRVWCGWLCPLGTLLEWLGPRRSSRVPPPERWRAVKYILLLVVLFAALLGNLSLIWLDPITILHRTLATAVWPALRYVVVEVEGLLYGFELLWGPLDVIHGAVVQPLFLDVQPSFSLAVLTAAFALGLVALNWWAPRFWCRYLCPLGGLLGLISKVSLVRREVGANCIDCARCGRQCPTGTIDPRDGFHSDSAECTVCFDCLVDCPAADAGFRLQVPGWRPERWRGYDPTRRQVLAAGGAAVLGVALLGVEPVTKRPPATLIRPPGARLTDFAALCIRCGACMRVCPTQGLQPSALEGGVQHLLTPRLVSRLGYCSFGCQACGQVCPTGAIPDLALQAKQETVIGLAAIDRDRCLPWAYDQPCIVCEEACPVADKAVSLEEVEVFGVGGETLLLQRPSVVKSLCIGCGTCEFQCPVGGEAAIRVYAPTDV
jgi:MauM/NapG family ferredoxin protein